ncbi:hypothetical protein GCM10011316_04490 [Roseibium aquae]|uniref:Uncharacterized protein n=1 Tax=Roseibium aquae TaxID=1323746 RepID=A0A916WWJ9_9HYPH|nr:hypothetical protein [Roseibium aquae]GGB35464.1 hypothetical protein GCM10011316_04490 [Roseibium aquae]
MDARPSKSSIHLARYAAGRSCAHRRLIVRVTVAGLVALSVNGPVLAQTNTLRTLDQGPANLRLPDTREQLDQTQSRQQQDFTTREQQDARERQSDIDRRNQDAMRNTGPECEAGDPGCRR